MANISGKFQRSGLTVIGDEVTSPVTFTPSISGGATLDVANSKSWYSRVGSEVSIKYYLQFTTVPSSSGTAFLIDLPNGITIDTDYHDQIKNADLIQLEGSVNLIQYTSGNQYDGTPYYDISDGKIKVFGGAGNNVWVLDAVTGHPTNTSATSWSIQAEVRFKVAEWSVSPSYANGRVEYASNSSTEVVGTWNTNDTTSFAYGTDGSLIYDGDLSEARAKRVRFKTPIQPTDNIEIQFKINGKWVAANGLRFDTSGWGLEGFRYATSGSGTGTAGIGWRPVSGSDTDIDVMFGKYTQAYWNGAALAGVEWSSAIATDAPRWRVVKSSNPLGIGAGLATDTQAGALEHNFKWQQKTLSADVTSTNSDVTDLKFTNLDTSKAYRLTLVIRAVLVENETDRNIYIKYNDGSNDIVQIDFRNDLMDQGTDDDDVVQTTLSASRIFTPASSTLTCSTFQLTANFYVDGAASSSPTYAILEELPNYTEVSEW